MNASEAMVSGSGDEDVLNWGTDAPRGGQAVMNRFLKEKATVPLFFGQTLIASLRDVGYNSTTSALCEHVDNALAAGAREIRVFFRQSGKKGNYEIDAAVYDNGRGMAPSVLKVATAFGASTSYNNRSGIGRFGMGMKTAALSISPVLEIYSWQERAAIYNMTLDVDAIGKERGNLVELPDPVLQTELPDEVAELFVKPMVYPADRQEQELLASSKDELLDRLGSSGTIIYMPGCDRLTYAKAKTLVDHAVMEMARVYRRAISNGLRLYINNRILEAFDPTYSMATARHTRVLDGVVKQSKLIVSKQVELRLNEHGATTAPITVKLFKLPIEEWSALGRKVLKNNLHIFDGLTVSILRNDREVFAGWLPEIITRHSVSYWYRLQIDFPGVLDEAFGVASNKQGVRMKAYVFDEINRAIGDDITTLNEEIKRYQASQANARASSKPSVSEAQATETDPYQVKPLQHLTDEEKEQIEANLRGLAVSLKRDGETDEEAFERVKTSKYLITYRHDEYWPFYHVEHRFGRIILTINTAHPFFSHLYDPIRRVPELGKEGTSNEEPPAMVSGAEQQQNGALVALELLLLSLARAQSILTNNNEEARSLLDKLRREWSETYRIQLTTA
jgi:hypothetical protein